MVASGHLSVDPIGWLTAMVVPPADLLDRESPIQHQTYLVYVAQSSPLQALSQVVCTRWCIESGCETAQGEVGLRILLAPPNCLAWLHRKR